jgi:hypothetical protein
MLTLENRQMPGSTLISLMLQSDEIRWGGRNGRVGWGHGNTLKVCARRGLLGEHVHRAVVSHVRRQVRVTRRHARQSQTTAADGQTRHITRLIQ